MQIYLNVTVYNPLKSRVGVSKAPFVDFFIMDFLRKYLLGCFNHIHISMVWLQFCCSNTCQIWM